MRDLRWLQGQVAQRKYLLSRHASQRMDQRGVLIQHVLQAIKDGKVLERQTHQGDVKLLLEGQDDEGTPFYVVVALSVPLPIIVTVCRFHDEVWEDVGSGRRRRRS